MIRSYLNKHWKTLTFFALLLGFGSWVLEMYTAWTAYQNSKLPMTGWQVTVHYNKFGEGPIEVFFLFPLAVIITGLAAYVFTQKYIRS